MKTKIILLMAVLAVMTSTFGQKSETDLTFTAIDSASYVQLDSIKVMNRTQGGDTVLYYPDTTLMIIINGGITDLNLVKSGFRVFQNYPNPAEDQTTITIYIPEQDKLDIMITDILGRMVIQASPVLEKGYHSFRFMPVNGSLFFFSAVWKGQSSGIKILHSASDPHPAGSLDYIGSDISSPQVKSIKAGNDFVFDIGDDLLFIGYSGTMESGILDSVSESQSYIFQYATNIPCPGTPIVTYEGQVYNTIQIFSQCWLKENLNVGTMINGTQNQTNNSIIEKYCHNNESDSCTKYGGLYQWDEMMQYTTQQGSQGICPPDWHLPADEEWIVLEGAVDSQYGIGNPNWDNQGLRGIDAGKNLKTTSGWQNNGNGTDLFGFSAMAASYRVLSGGFDVTGAEGVWWMSTQSVTDYAWYHNIHYFSPKIGRFADSYSYKEYGFSVRCIRDY
jgi:uncharacterized protein (TIGR02145 family)